MPGPLEGIRVLEVANWLAVPGCAALLTDLGAETIKVEQPGGDGWRGFRLGTRGWDNPPPGNPMFEVDNRGKRSITVNLDTPDGKALVHKLALQADVFVTNFPLPVRDRLGLSPQHLLPLNPRLIYASFTAYGEEGAEAAKTGFDSTAYWARTGLMDMIRKAIDRTQERAEHQQLKEKVSGRYTFANVVGQSKKMTDLFELIESVAPSDANVLITGESGTGKEVVARHIHHHSNRRSKPIVPLNCGAIPPDLLESELFGHEKGAFTGAITARQGRFEMADGGTLFLDEIGDMPMEAQTRLLRVLQQGEYTTVGGRTPIKTDVRIVAAATGDPSRIVDSHGGDDSFYDVIGYVWLLVPAGIAFVLSVVTDVPLGAVGGAVVIVIVLNILGAIEALGTLRRLLPTEYGDAWTAALAPTVSWGDMAIGGSYSIVLFAILVSVAVLRFDRKDILS